ncbi:MFS transporter [Dermabacteraceae bacterium P13147]
MPIASHRAVLRARRLMVVGLVVTVLGNRLIDGGFEALTAAGAITVTTLVVVSSLSTVSVMAFPAYARWLKKFSPDSALITVDLLEALLSLVAILVTLAAPQYGTAAVVAYVLIDLFLAPVSDIAEEFYGAKLADYGEDEALAFNSSLYALLGLLGLVVASPLGAVLSGLSTVVLLAANVVLSLAGAAFRGYARSRAPMPPAVDADDEEFTMTGERLPWRQFLHDLLASGPASPLLSLALDLVGELTGRLLFLWVAARAAMEPHAAMGLVLAVFGAAATLGPLLGRRLRGRWDTGPVLRVTALLSLVNALVLLAQVLYGSAGFASGIAFVFVNVMLNRSRMVVLETHRQVFFKGTQFSRIMSWSYSFGAVGTLIGLQIGYWLHTVDDPTYTLVLVAFAWLAIAAVVNSSRRGAVAGPGGPGIESR